MLWGIADKDKMDILKIGDLYEQKCLKCAIGIIR
tara:strand:- start:86 stop:187 length:102 start_codon:yes stop_codon:yes gene_type:complete